MVTYKLANDVVASNIAGEIVILNYQTGTYYSLNEVGAYVWETISQKPADFDELATGILTNFSVESPICEADLRTLLNTLLHEKLIEKA